jgi:Protein of unknown function (DUF4240)
MRGVKNWDHFTPEDIPEEFWTLIDRSRQDREGFKNELKNLNKGSLIRLAWLIREAAAMLQTDAHIRNVDPQHTEDSLNDLTLWVVAQGRDRYADIFYNPDHIPARVDRHDHSLSVLSDVVTEYRSRYNEPIPARL